jgi:4-amino-4-deoxychorismate lyase
LLINGQPSHLISALDRGLQYGDGLFETLAVINGKPALLDRHLERLVAGCQALGMVQPDINQLREESRAEAAQTSRAVLKIILTRGEGGRGYNPASTMTPTRIIHTTPWPDYPDDHARVGVAVRLCDTRLGWNARLAGLKHLNRLEQVLARAEWSDPGINEGVVLDGADNVIEGTMSNLFLVKSGQLITPLLDQCGVKGIMRQVVIETARTLAIKAEEQQVRVDDLKAADGLFLTNSLIGIWPVRVFDGVEYPVNLIDQTLLRTVISKGFATV